MAGLLKLARACSRIDTLEQLASAQKTTPHDLLPLSAPPDALAFLRGRGQALFDEFERKADREAWQMLVPPLAKMVEGPAGSR